MEHTKCLNSSIFASCFRFFEGTAECASETAVDTTSGEFPGTGPCPSCRGDRTEADGEDLVRIGEAVWSAAAAAFDERVEEVLEGSSDFSSWGAGRRAD